MSADRAPADPGAEFRAAIAAGPAALDRYVAKLHAAQARDWEQQQAERLAAHRAREAARLREYRRRKKAELTS